MRSKEVLEHGQSKIRNINIQVPANTPPLVITLIQQLAAHLSNQPQPLSHEELQKRINAAHWDKMRRLAIIYQNRRIWNAGNLVSKKNKEDAQRYGESEIPDVDIESWLDSSGHIKIKP
jgi:hypothetical protein